MMKHGSHRNATRGAVLFAAAVCLPAMTLALAAKPAQSDEASAGAQTPGERVMIRQTDGEHPKVVLRRSTPEQRLAAFLDLDIEDPMQRELVELLVELGVSFDGPEANVAEGMPGGRVLFRNGEQVEGQPMMLRRGDGENAEGERRVILRNDEIGEGQPMMLRRGDGESVEGARRVLIRNGEHAEGQPMMLRLRNGANADGKPRVIMLKDLDAETLAETLEQVLDAEQVEVGPMILRGDGENADGERRIIIRNDENGEGERKILIRNHASQE